MTQGVVLHLLRGQIVALLEDRGNAKLASLFNCRFKLINNLIPLFYG